MYDLPIFLAGHHTFTDLKHILNTVCSLECTRTCALGALVLLREPLAVTDHVAPQVLPQTRAGETREAAAPPVCRERNNT